MINQGIERIRLLLTELEEDRVRISQKADDLKQAIDAVTDASTEIDGGEDFQSPFGLGQRLTIGIPNIEKKNDEAIFDAMAEFNKMCPYCGKNQYHLGYRDKIEIDHFFPVSKGGQHVPWNILPVCKDCNRKKRDKAPRDYLSTEVFQRCHEYLMRVKQRYHDEGIQQIEGSVKLKSLIDENFSFLKTNSSEKFVFELLHIFYPEKLIEVYSKHENAVIPIKNDDPIDIESVISRAMRDCTDEFCAGAIMGPWQPFVDELQKKFPSHRISIPNLYSAARAAGWLDLGKVKTAELQLKRHILCSPDLLKRHSHNRSEIRRALEKLNPGNRRSELPETPNDG
jgi:hypothetical protein